MAAAGTDSMFLWTTQARRLLAGVFVLVCLAGCAPSQNLRVDDQQALHKIYVAPQASMPEHPTIITRNMGFGAGLGGAVGAVVASLGSTTDEQFVGYLAKNDIHVDLIVAKAFSEKLAEARTFTMVPSIGEADATIKLDVVMYGIGYTANMFSHDYRALLAMKATMSRADGKVLWIKQAAFNAMMGGERPAVPFDELFSQPERMREQMTLAGEAAAAELVAQLSGKAK